MHDVYRILEENSCNNLILGLKRSKAQILYLHGQALGLNIRNVFIYAGLMAKWLNTCVWVN